MRLVRNFFISFGVILSIVILTAVLWLRDRYTVPILTYHHVQVLEKDNLNSLNNVTPEVFAWQMKFIAKHNYHVISFDDYVRGVEKGFAFSRNTVVIHFDDGYSDNYLNAFPVLKTYNFPAMISLITSEMDEPGFLTWDQIKVMEASNITFGAHTQQHVYLPDVSIDVARQEIVGSKKDIEMHLGHPVQYFVYPSGGFTDDVQGIVREAGFKAAGTTNRGRDRFNRNLFEINRIRVKNSDNALILWAKLTGYYNLYRESKFTKPYKIKEY